MASCWWRIRNYYLQTITLTVKYTFGRRLRATGVSFENRQDLPGHRSSRITTHYSAAELQNLIEATKRVCGENSRKSPELVVLRKVHPFRCHCNGLILKDYFGSYGWA
jgi:hypothetical protein